LKNTLVLHNGHTNYIPRHMKMSLFKVGMSHPHASRACMQPARQNFYIPIFRPLHLLPQYFGSLCIYRVFETHPTSHSDYRTVSPYFKHCLWMTKMEFFDFFEKVLFFTVFVLRMSDVFDDLKNVKIAKRSLKICQF
jgi:hypothetical protein